MELLLKPDSESDDDILEVTKSASYRKSAENFRFSKVIGEGSFSTVYLGKCIDTGKEYASK